MNSVSGYGVPDEPAALDLVEDESALVDNGIAIGQLQRIAGVQQIKLFIGVPALDLGPNFGVNLEQIRRTESVLFLAVNHHGIMAGSGAEPVAPLRTLRIDV